MRTPARGVEKEIIEVLESLCTQRDFIGEIMAGANEYEQLMRAEHLAHQLPTVAAYLLVSQLWALEEVGYLDSIMGNES